MFKKWQTPLIIMTLLIALLVSTIESTAPVNLNTASQTELELIPGIGSSIASKIILERNRRGGFRSIQDLLKIRGIGRKRLEKLEKYLKVDGP